MQMNFIKIVMRYMWASQGASEKKVVFLAFMRYNEQGLRILAQNRSVNNMAWLEITVDTAADTVDTVAAQLTARGFSDLVIEDQAEFETFLEENRGYWDYIDEDF